MFFVLLTLIFISLTLPQSVKAQVPLFHQLIAAYQPQKNLISATPQVLGITTANAKSTPLDAGGYPYGAKSIPSPSKAPIQSETSPQNVGGEGSITTIAFLGDSMIQTLDSQIIERSLAKYYPHRKFNILNYGLPATDIEYGLSRLPSLISQKPNLIIVESFAYNNFGNTQSGIDRQWSALSTITTDIKNKLPQTKILLSATIAPHSVVFGNGSQFNFTSLEKIEKTNTIKLYLQNLVNFATSQNFPLANAFTKSLVSNQGNLNFISDQDHIHPSLQGSAFFADTVASTIFRYLLI